jgi:hypothetical protein
MSCACKVVKHINSIQKHYGVNVLPTKKTDIKGSVKKIVLNFFSILLFIPLFPIILIFILIRNCFTKKPIFIDNFLKLKNKDVRNK